jgi:acetylornithine/N-succinyldiaminopimelate aminotransferase
MIHIDKESFVHESAVPRQFGTDFLVLREGKGVYLFDTAGKRYIDFGSGISVNALGYGRKDLAKIAYTQMKKIIHVSNLYATEPALRLGERLAASGNFAAVHFGNSGTEAHEAALKYARVYSQRVKGGGNFKLLTFEHAFHGRTLGALAVSPSPAYQEPFAPLMPGVEVSPYNDVEALERTLNSSFAGVIVEVVQGEGGLTSMTPEFAESLNRLCAQYNVILIADEVQTGLGRTGSLYASTAAGLKPDIITLAKPLAGGLPLSATLIPKKVNDILKPGDHGTTFGGGPVTTAVANRVWDIVTKPKFLTWVNERADALGAELTKIARTHSTGDIRIGSVRGKGLLRGLEVIAPEDKTAGLMKSILTIAQGKGLLLLRSGKNVLRIAPPLVVTSKEIQAGCDILAAAIQEAFAAIK